MAADGFRAASADFSHYVTEVDGLSHLDLAVEGITCAACIGDIEQGLRKLPGVVSARVNYTLHRVGVEWHRADVAPAAIVDTLDRLGYRAHPYAPRAAEEASRREMRTLLRALAIAGFAAMNIMLLSVSVWAGNVTDITPETRDFFHWLSALIALPAAAFAGQPFFTSAFRALRQRRTNMDVPISIGVLLALGVSLYETATHAEHAYFDSAIMLLFFLLAGRTLDQAMRRRTRTLAGNLLALRAELASRIDADGSETVVPAAALVPGDLVRVRPGERIAADAVVTVGTGAVDESMVTGETLPRVVRAGDQVYGGSLVQGAMLSLRVAAAPGGSVVDVIEKLLDKASEARSKRLALADRAARLYAPVVHLTAALSAAGWLAAGAGVHQAVIIATTVLIITCPCALALAIPAVQVVAAGAFFRRGIFLNQGNAIERLADADTVVFDKTGTLTLPESYAINATRVPAAIVAKARRLALTSRHPLAVALAAEDAVLLPYEGALEQPGEGVRALVEGTEARLGSPAFCAVDVPRDDAGASALAFRHGDETALFFVRQTLRPDAAAVIRRLKAMGLECRILSGDRIGAVESVARAVGIEHYAGAMKPDGKIAALAALAAEGRKVVMVGDGLNDAPALAAAHVSLSPISAVDIAQAEADAVFLGQRLAPVAEAIEIARRARGRMTENLAFAVAYNMAAVPLAIFGLVTPLIAALAMSGSSLVVTLNALRARPQQSAERSAEPAAAREVAYL